MVKCSTPVLHRNLQKLVIKRIPKQSCISHCISHGISHGISHCISYYMCFHQISFALLQLLRLSSDWNRLPAIVQVLPGAVQVPTSKPLPLKPTPDRPLSEQIHQHVRLKPRQEERHVKVTITVAANSSP